MPNKIFPSTPNTPHGIEILAPCGSFNSVLAAVRTGAHAVYVGAQRFSARAFAENFNKKQIKYAIDYCHLHGVKLHLAINTLIRDDEMSDALDFATTAYSLGADALIIQDIGFAAAVKSALPDCVLHASTQMSVCSPAGARLAQHMGFSRVVLARELTRGEISEITDCCSVETEVFVHGALCMCVSGQCLLSSMLGGRSGNRGKCAQPCRLPFSVKGGTGHDLSLKDNSIIGYLPELARMGVTSAKIEGRMKRPEYTAAAVTACKEICQASLGGTSHTSTTTSSTESSEKKHTATSPENSHATMAAGNPSLPTHSPAQQALRAVFSRSGFTDGYYTGKRGKHMFGTRTKEDVLAADARTLADLRVLYKNEVRMNAVDMRLTVKAGKPAVLTATCGGHTVTVTGDVPQTAKTTELTEKSAALRLSKTGGTSFYLRNITSDIDKGLALSVASLNFLRRESLNNLETEICESYRRQAEVPTASASAGVPTTSPCSAVLSDEVTHSGSRENTSHCQQAEVPATSASTGVPSTSPYSAVPSKEVAHGVPCEKTCYRASFKNCDIDDIFLECEWIYVPLFSRTDKLAELVRRGFRVAVELPRIGFGLDGATRKQLKAVKSIGITDAYCGSIGAVSLAMESGFTVHGGYAMNIFNTDSLNVCTSLGFADTEVSVELKTTQINRLGGSIRRGVVGYGYLPLMIMRNCPNGNGNGAGRNSRKSTSATVADSIAQAGGCVRCGGRSEITDRLGKRFTLMCENGCVELLNTVPLNIAYKVSSFGGADFIALRFTKETRRESAEIFADFRQGKKPRGEYTAGLYFRGTL